MRELQLKLELGKKPAYQKIADALRCALRNGRVPRGDLVPSTRALSRQLEVHRHTALKKRSFC